MSAAVTSAEVYSCPVSDAETGTELNKRLRHRDSIAVFFKRFNFSSPRFLDLIVFTDLFLVFNNISQIVKKYYISCSQRAKKKLRDGSGGVYVNFNLSNSVHTPLFLAFSSPQNCSARLILAYRIIKFTIFGTEASISKKRVH